MNQHPMIIQGGMGAGVSDWRLANTVSSLGQLGVVSGTAIDEILLRRLQAGDPGGHMRRGMDAFPFPAMAERLWSDYYIPGGKADNVSFRTAPGHRKDDPRAASERCIVGNFVEVFLAREGHSNPVGINYLEKIQIPHLPSIYGAMLAGVDYVLMGAGIPLKIPGVLDLYVNHQAATYPLVVSGSIEGDDTTMHFDPRDYIEGDPGPLKRPHFLAIISSNTLAVTMLRKANGRVDGFIIEGQTAGGHNAPPRGKLQLNEAGEPVYGVRDTIDLEKIRELNVPFWLAGGYGSAEAVRSALKSGATGVQVGTAFAFTRESGLRDDYKQALLQKSIAGVAKVFTDPLASPTGFPFKVALLEGSFSEEAAYKARPRICDLSYLREPYRTADGTIGYRCASEPLSLYLSKGGHLDETVGRKCVCNGLVANIGFPQVRAGGKHVEQGLITAGDDLENVADFLPAGASSYGVADVINRLLDETAPTSLDEQSQGSVETGDLLVAVDSWAGI